MNQDQTERYKMTTITTKEMNVITLNYLHYELQQRKSILDHFKYCEGLAKSGEHDGVLKPKEWYTMTIKTREPEYKVLDMIYNHVKKITKQ